MLATVISVRFSTIMEQNSKIDLFDFYVGENKLPILIRVNVLSLYVREFENY